VGATQQSACRGTAARLGSHEGLDVGQSPSVVALVDFIILVISAMLMIALVVAQLHKKVLLFV
jgi:hypothetical protein